VRLVHVVDEPFDAGAVLGGLERHGVERAHVVLDAAEPAVEAVLAAFELADPRFEVVSHGARGVWRGGCQGWAKVDQVGVVLALAFPRGGWC
jgi:uncharacterized protein (UPF0548 family)